MRLTNEGLYIFEKRGWFYFSRRIPSDIQQHYTTPRIVFALRTRSKRSAVAKATSMAAKLDEDWLTLRWRRSNDPTRRFLRLPGSKTPVSETNTPSLSEALDLYLRLKGNGRSKVFRQTAERAIGYFVEMFGDRPVDQYSRQQVNDLRDALFARGLARTSVKRLLTTIRAVVNFAVTEEGLPEIRTFASVYLGEIQSGDTSKRAPIPPEVIRTVQAECAKMDDQNRWPIALVSDTGMRLSEAAGLIKDDIVLSGSTPHILLREHPWRPLKTRGSERQVPLVGASLWAAQRAVLAAETPYLFDRYSGPHQTNSNSASAALNKWLRPRVPQGCVIHSFRHSFRDRLRAAECPKDIIDRLGGWAVAGVSEGYGQGYPLSVLSKWMMKLT